MMNIVQKIIITELTATFPQQEVEVPGGGRGRAL